MGREFQTLGNMTASPEATAESIRTVTDCGKRIPDFWEHDGEAVSTKCSTNRMVSRLALDDVRNKQRHENAKGSVSMQIGSDG